MEEIDRPADKKPSFAFRPSRVECRAEPVREPFKHLRRRATHVEQHLNGGDAVFNRRVKSFGICQKTVEEKRRLLIVAINGGQITFQIRKARIINAKRGNARRALPVSRKNEPQLQETIFGALQEKF